MPIRIGYAGNTMLVEIDGLRNAATGAYVNGGATVAAQFKTLGGLAIGGSIALDYVAGSSGDWRGEAASTLALIAGQEVMLEVTATVSGVGVALWKSRVRIWEREE